MPLTDVAVSFVAVTFAFMGLVAIAAPTRVTGQFDIPALSASGRNEVRAVYGGFGLAMAGMLVAALNAPGLRLGIVLAIAAALAGMAGGRLLSAVMDRRIGRFPLMYMGIEAVGATLLAYAA
jgi:hypothetical protein